MELCKDGTGVNDDKSISWKVENERFVILSSGKGLSCDYDVSGSELTLFKDDVDIKKYIKKEMWDILERAFKAIKNGKYDEAISGFSEAIKKDPNYVGAYIGRANVYAIKKDYDNAIAKYTEAIRISKKPLDIFGAYLAKAETYSKMKEYDKAIADLELALQTLSSTDYKDFGSTTLKEGIIEVIKEQIDILKKQKRSK
jgi:tetratricopeptide (TPR) repeat protein